VKAKDYLKKYGVKLAAAVAIVVIISLVGASVLKGRAGGLSNALGALTQPVETAVGAAAGWFEDLYGYLYEYDMRVEEINELRSTIASLQDEARDYDAVVEENAMLRELLGLQEKRADFVFETAKIVSWDSSNYSSAFTISKGSNNGIKVGDCVITEYGALVGQVIEVGDIWARVQTVIDVNTDVGALVGSNRYAGIVSGEFSAMQDGQTRITYLTSGASIFEQDEVLTSGKGGLFPSGLLIGTVTSVMTEAGGQTIFGIVEPACNLTSLSQIVVIKEFDIVE